MTISMRCGAIPMWQRQSNPGQALWHIFNRRREVPEYASRINFSTVNNLIAALGVDSLSVAELGDFLAHYDAKISDSPAYHHVVIQDLLPKGLNYYQDVVRPNKQFRPPTDEERALLGQLAERLSATNGATEEELQAIPFDLAREAEIPPKALFRMFYEVVLGQERGPRFGSLVQLVGKEQVVKMVREKA